MPRLSCSAPIKPQVLRHINADRSTRSATMYAPLLLLFALFAQAASANDTLWQQLKTEPNLVVLMRHTHAAGGNPVAWDETGGCAGELMLTPKGRTSAKKIGEAFAQQNIKPTVISSPMCRCRETARIAFGEAAITDPDLREIASADPNRTANFERKAQSLIASHRGASPLIFVSHRPNIDLLSLQLIDDGVLLVARASANGEVTVLGTLTLPP